MNNEGRIYFIVRPFRDIEQSVLSKLLNKKYNKIAF